MTMPNTTKDHWFDEARFGMFIHWGPYAVAARGEWVMNRERIPLAEYTECYVDEWRAEKYDPAAWVQLAKDAGMGYVMLTTLYLYRDGVHPDPDLEVPDCYHWLISSLATHQTLLGDAIATRVRRSLPRLSSPTRSTKTPARPRPCGTTCSKSTPLKCPRNSRKRRSIFNESLPRFQT